MIPIKAVSICGFADSWYETKIYQTDEPSVWSLRDVVEFFFFYGIDVVFQTKI